MKWWKGVSFAGFYSQTLFSSSCEVNKGKYSPYINKEEANGVILSCENPYGKNIITCKNLYQNEFIQEVNGLELNLKLSSKLEDLPSYIPVYDKRPLNTSFNEPFIGITLNDILKSGIKFRAGKLHEQNKIIIKDDFLLGNAFKYKKVILFLTGADTLIEWIWYNRKECDFFKIIKQMGFWGISGFNFSVIGGECPFAHALNQKRSLYSSIIAEEHGLQAIPHVYALNNYHIERWLEWFSINPLLNYFVMNCQLQKSRRDIRQVIFIIRHLLKQLPHMHVILQGFPMSDIWEFGEFLERIHFADKGAIKYAQTRNKIYHDIRKNKIVVKPGCDEKFEDLACNNITVRQNFIEHNRHLFRSKTVA